MTRGTRLRIGAGQREFVPFDPSPPGSVVLEIGVDAGALIVSTPASLLGHEIEVTAVGQPWRGKHTAVRARVLGDRVAYAGVFPRLRAGAYELRVRGGLSSERGWACIRAGEAAETWLGAAGR